MKFNVGSLEFASELKKSSSISSLDSAFTEGVRLLMVIVMYLYTTHLSYSLMLFTIFFCGVRSDVSM